MVSLQTDPPSAVVLGVTRVMSVLISHRPSDMLENYQAANLIPLLETIRKPGRYAGLNGVNALTNAAPDGTYNEAEVTRELRRAVEAGRRKDHDFVPEFTHPKQGFAYGLNPYSDWALAQLKAPPTHYFLFLGLDWYAISGLGNTDSWFDDLHNPFLDAEDLYWHNVWAWILRKHKTSASGTLSWQTPIMERDAAAFIRADGGGFVFHNRIPYLRPAGYESTDTDWCEIEWKKKSVRQDVTDDLCVLRRQTKGRIVAICTGEESVKALVEAGYDRIVSWKAHPSQFFYPRKFVEKDLWFESIARQHSC